MYIYYHIGRTTDVQTSAINIKENTFIFKVIYIQEILGSAAFLRT